MFLAKYLTRATQAKNEQIENVINDGLIDLRNGINRKEIPENENQKKVVEIVEKILDFNKQQKRKALKLLSRKQMFQGLPIAIAQVKRVTHLKTYSINETNQRFFAPRKRSF